MPMQGGKKACQDAMDLRLRELSRSDLPRINHGRNQPEAVESLESPLRYVDSEVDTAWFDNYMANRGSNVRLVVWDVAAGDLLGIVYLLNINWINRHGELSIWIPDVRHRGRGIGAFAMDGMLRHAFEGLNLNRVWLRVLAGNLAAIALYGKFGFVQEGIHRGAQFKNGAYRDKRRWPYWLPHIACAKHNNGNVPLDVL